MVNVSSTYLNHTEGGGGAVRRAISLCSVDHLMYEFGEIINI